MEPLEYLAPFLEVIKSPETSGPITAVALTAVNRFLERDILGEGGPGGGAVPPGLAAHVRMAQRLHTSLALQSAQLPEGECIADG